MNFTDPQTVTSPKGSVADLAVLLNTGENGWSLASLTWDGQPALGVRWNGHADNPIGNPQSRGIPTWFVLPDELAALITDHLRPAQPFAFDAFPEDIRRVRLRPLPKRFLRGKDQGPMDFVWNVERVDKEKGIVWLTNPATGHHIPLYEAHVAAVVPDALPDKDGLQHGILQLTVQMFFEDTAIRLELLPRGLNPSTVASVLNTA